MAKRGRVKLSIKGFNKLRNDPAVVADLKRRAKAVADAAGKGFEQATHTGKSRARAYVITGSNTAKREQSKSNVLQRALNSGR